MLHLGKVITWSLSSTSIPRNAKCSSQVQYYHKGNFVAIQTCLQGINWNERWKDKSVNDTWCYLVQLLKDQTAIHVPPKQQSLTHSLVDHRR